MVEKLTNMPRGVMLHQNYPNPFMTQTTFIYEIEKEGNLQLDVLNVFGARVATLVDESHSPGVYRAGFEPMSLPAGMYTAVLRITSGQHVISDYKVLTHIK